MFIDQLRCSRSLDQEIKLVAVIALIQNNIASLIVDFPDNISNLNSLVLIDFLQQRYLSQKVAVFFASLPGSLIHNVAECVSIEHPAVGVGLGND